MDNKIFYETVEGIVESLGRSHEEETKVIEKMLETGSFLNARQGLEIGRSISEGFAEGLGVKSDDQ